MSRGAFQTLHDLNEGEGPSIFIAQRQEQEMDVVWHNYACVQIDSWFPVSRGRGRPRHTTFPETVVENEIAGLCWQGEASSCAEGDEHRRISFLQVWKPPSIAVLGK